MRTKSRCVRGFAEEHDAWQLVLFRIGLVSVGGKKVWFKVRLPEDKHFALIYCIGSLLGLQLFSLRLQNFCK